MGRDKSLLGLEIIIYSESVCPVVGHLIAVCMWLFMSRLEKVGDLCRIVFCKADLIFLKKEFGCSNRITSTEMKGKGIYFKY